MPYRIAGDDRRRCIRCGSVLRMGWWCSDCNAPDHDRRSYDEGDYEEGLIRPYDWLPPGGLSFKGSGPPFYGMEIEVTDYDEGSQETAVQALGRGGELGWLKTDGTVEGFEIVTHPMSYDWAMAHWPWGMLPELGKTGSYIIPESNGLHVHVSVAGFAGGGHELSWVKFFYRNAEPIIAIARRETNEYSSFRPSVRQTSAAALQKQKLIARQRARRKLLIDSGVPDDQVDDDPALRRMKDQAADLRAYPAEDRYNAINLHTPHGTYEVRAFASTLVPRQAQAALGLVAGTVEYTRHLTVPDIIRGGGWNWGHFVRWLKKQGGTYAPLLAEIKERK